MNTKWSFTPFKVIKADWDENGNARYTVDKTNASWFDAKLISISCEMGKAIIEWSECPCAHTEVELDNLAERLKEINK